jgi:predicted RNA-binding protein with PIN domain
VAGGNEVSDAFLRPALEWTIEYLRAARLHDPALRYPSRLRQFLAQRHLSVAELKAVRRLIDRDSAFRETLSASVPDDADPIVRLWLTRPVGWESTLADLEAADLKRRLESEQGSELAREVRRRQAAEARADAAEQALNTAESRCADFEGASQRLAAEIETLSAEVERLRSELASLKTELRHERDRHGATSARLEAARAAERQAAADAEHAAQITDKVLQDRSDVLSVGIDLADIVEQARRLSARIAELVPEPDQAVREPLAVPGRLSGDRVAAAQHLVRSGATVIVDGYNVAKRWRPTHDLRSQRELLVAGIEAVVSRLGADIAVVFDGDEVIGSHAVRRSPVRVMWSPRGVTADDVIRAEVQRLPLNRPVIVVTDDREIINDVRVAGANHVGSDAFIGLLER